MTNHTEQNEYQFFYKLFAFWHHTSDGYILGV